MPFPMWAMIFYRFDVPCMFLVCNKMILLSRLSASDSVHIVAELETHIERICIAWFALNRVVFEWKREKENQIFHLITASFAQEISAHHPLLIHCIRTMLRIDFHLPRPGCVSVAEITFSIHFIVASKIVSNNSTQAQLNCLSHWPSKCARIRVHFH